MEGITLEEAKYLIETAIEEGAEESIAAAVVGIDCSLVALLVMDEALPFSGDVAIGKACTAITRSRDTKDIPDDASTFIDDGLVLSGGGVLIKRGDIAIGALGISGKGGGEKDHELARKALDRITLA